MTDKFQILKNMAREYKPNDMSLEEYTVKLANKYSKVCKCNYNLQQENELLKKKLDKAIELLIEYNMPCEMNDFMNKNVDYCSSNCGVDEEVYKKCWLRYIEQELEK